MNAIFLKFFFVIIILCILAIIISALFREREKSTAIAYILWLIGGFGVLGFQRFYLGKIGSGLLWFFTGGVFGIGALFDLFTLRSKVETHNMSLQLKDITNAAISNTQGIKNNISASQTSNDFFKKLPVIDKQILFNQLSQLLELREKNVISEEIYENEKAEIISKLQPQKKEETKDYNTLDEHLAPNFSEIKSIESIEISKQESNSTKSIIKPSILILGLSSMLAIGFFTWAIIKKIYYNRELPAISTSLNDRTPKYNSNGNDLQISNDTLKSNVLSSFAILKSLYHSNQNFDEENQLVREVVRDKEHLIFRTRLGKIFYYENAGNRRATAILFSYRYTNGIKDWCHQCYPEFDVANFEFVNGNWLVRKFIQNWDGGTGTWGEPADISNKTHHNRNCICIYWSYSGGGGGFEDGTNYYDIESLKLVK